MIRASCTVLISSAGRRVELLGAFRAALADCGIDGRILAADATPLSAACAVADEAFVVPRCADPAFVPSMLELCAANDVKLLVPTIDPELPPYAASRNRFADAGTAVAVSCSETVTIGSDKVRTHAWLREHGFPTVDQADAMTVVAALSDWQGPLIVKPRFGSASIGVRRLESASALGHLASTGVDLTGHVVQSVARGIEHTVDVLVSREGRVVEAVPRRRLEVRAGEVSKAVTVRHPGLEHLARELATALPGARGVLNVQVFVDGDDLAVVEINPRFGGGYPLADRAGARFAQWLVAEASGTKPPAVAWDEGVVMLRYDAAVFVDASSVGL